MPTRLTLNYFAYITVSVPNKIARKLQEAQPRSIQEYAQEPFAFGNKRGDLFFQGADGKKQYKITGNVEEVDYKHADDGHWSDEEESDDEGQSSTKPVLAPEVLGEEEIPLTDEDMKKMLGEEEEDEDEEDE
jgi:hypothetical protein